MPDSFSTPSRVARATLLLGLLAAALFGACGLQEPTGAPEDNVVSESTRALGGSCQTWCSGCPAGSEKCDSCMCSGDPACCLNRLGQMCLHPAPGCGSNGICDCKRGLVSAAASCSNACGVYDAGRVCQCDLQCGKFNDCCSDITTMCPMYSCSGHCGAAYDSSKYCQCDSACSTFGDCCPDKAKVCTTTTCTCNSDCTLKGNCCKTCL